MIAGPGWVAGEHIKAYLADDRTEIRAVVGTMPEDRARAAGYMEKRGFKCDYIEDYGAALRREDIDVVAICTISSMHFAQALAALQAGKHVFVEKPLCLGLDELKALRSASQGKRVRTHVGHICRYYPAARGIFDFVRDGGIGEVFYAESDYWHEIVGPWKVAAATAGSALLMGGVHSVDMMRWLIGEDRPAREVVAYAQGSRRRKDFDYDPTICMMVRFDDAVGKVATSLECDMPYVFHLHACGTAGAVRENGLFSDRFPGQKRFMALPADYPDDWDVARHPFSTEVNYFVNCIVNGEESELSFGRAYATYELIFAAELSAKAGRPVKLPLA